MTLREVGERPEFEFEPRDHLELGLGERLDRDGEGGGGVRLAVRLPARRPGDRRAGAGPLRDRPARRARASSRSFRRSWSARARSFGTGFFPGEREMIYEIPRDELFLVGTSEVSLAALHAGEILAADELPLRYAGLLHLLSARGGRGRQGHARASSASTSSTRWRCSRSFGPRTPQAEHERLLAIQERILQALEIPYRVVDIPLGDLGRLGGAQVRLRGVDPQPVALPRGHLVLEHDRLPGPPARLPLPPRAGRPAGARPHAERHRRRGRPHPHRADRERPARRRLGRASAGALATRERPRRSAGS